MDAGEFEHIPACAIKKPPPLLAGCGGVDFPHECRASFCNPDNCTMLAKPISFVLRSINNEEMRDSNRHQ